MDGLANLEQKLMDDGQLNKALPHQTKTSHKHITSRTEELLHNADLTQFQHNYQSRAARKRFRTTHEVKLENIREALLDTVDPTSKNKSLLALLRGVEEQTCPVTGEKIFKKNKSSSNLIRI